MGRVTIELSDTTLRAATLLAAKKGVPVDTFLAHSLDELVAANDRYERARASVAHRFPDVEQDPLSGGDAEQFFDRWRNSRS
jgi:hypothetical protein